MSVFLYMRSIVMTVTADRPEYLSETLKSWNVVRGVRDWDFTLVVEPGAKLRQTLELVSGLLPEAHVLLNDTRRGVLGNPHFALSRGFAESEFVVLCEEDVVVSNDILDYLSWADVSFVDDSDVLAACASSLNHFEGVDPQLCIPYRHFSPLVWGTWRDRWENVLCDTWDLDYTSGPTLAEGGWDWNIGRLMKARDMRAVFPDVSRSLHIGVYGAHVTPESFPASQAPSFVPVHAVNYWRRP